MPDNISANGRNYVTRIILRETDETFERRLANACNYQEEFRQSRCRNDFPTQWTVGGENKRKAVNLAFANMCAMFHTALLNGKATCASALPIANSLRLGLLRGPHKKRKSGEPLYWITAYKWICYKD